MKEQKEDKKVPMDTITTWLFYSNHFKSRNLKTKTKKKDKHLSKKKLRNHSAPRQATTAINEKTSIENHQQEQQKNKTGGENLKRSNSVFHRSLLKKIKKTINVVALEIECLSHNINVSSLKISNGKI